MRGRVSVGGAGRWEMERQSEAAMAKWRAQLDQRTKELEALQVRAQAS